MQQQQQQQQQQLLQLEAVPEGVRMDLAEALFSDEGELRAARRRPPTQALFAPLLQSIVSGLDAASTPGLWTPAEAADGGGGRGVTPPLHAAVVGYTAAAAAGDASAAVPLATSLSHAKQAASVAVERPPQLMAAWAELLSGASAELENSPLTTPGAPQQVVAAAQEDVRMRCSPAPWR